MRLKSKKKRNQRIFAYVLSSVFAVVIIMYYEASDSSISELSHFTGTTIRQDSIIGFVDRSTIRDFSAAWLFHYDDCILTNVMEKSAIGFKDQTLFAKEEASLLFGCSQEYFDGEVYISNYNQRYEIWILFNRDERMAFAMMF